jgi:hypothetical protein
VRAARSPTQIGSLLGPIHAPSCCLARCSSIPFPDTLEIQKIGSMHTSNFGNDATTSSNWMNPSHDGDYIATTTVLLSVNCDSRMSNLNWRITLCWDFVRGVDYHSHNSFYDPCVDTILLWHTIAWHSDVLTAASKCARCDKAFTQCDTRDILSLFLTTT